MRQCKCGSYAINDDPDRLKCDRCWRDETINRLATQVTALKDEAFQREARIMSYIAKLAKLTKERDALKEANNRLADAAICPDDRLPENVRQETAREIFDNNFVVRRLSDHTLKALRVKYGIE